MAERLDCFDPITVVTLCCKQSLEGSSTLCTFFKEVTAAGTGGFNSINNIKFVTQNSYEFFTTYGTGLCVQAVSICASSMAQSINNVLCNQYFVTYRAVLAFGQTGGLTTSSNSCVGHFGVT